MYGRLLAAIMLAFVFVAMLAMAMAARAAAPRQVGVAQAVPDLQTVAATRQALRWTALAGGGQVAALTLASPGATALRAGLRVGELPESAILRFSGPGDSASAQVSGARVLAALERNRQAGDSGAAARTWWSPVVAGASLVMEVELPPGVDPQAVAITVPFVSHLTLDVRAELAALRSAGDAARAIALYTDDGATYECPAVLMAPASAPAAHPYLLTANRCIASQSAASSLELFWETGDAQETEGDPCNGAALLYAAAGTDTAFLALDVPPPAAPAYARWPADGAKLALDPALEQWLGRGAASGSGTSTFRLP